MDWIDVNEKLPETGIDSVYGSAWLLVVYMFDGECYVREGKFINTPNPFWINIYRDEVNVTHWMPLPQPPM